MLPATHTQPTRLLQFNICRKDLWDELEIETATISVIKQEGSPFDAEGVMWTANAIAGAMLAGKPGSSSEYDKPRSKLLRSVDRIKPE